MTPTDTDTAAAVRAARLPRRRFLGALIAPAAALFAARVHAGETRGAARTAERVALLIDAAHGDAAALVRGARLGAEEVEHTATLLRRELHFIEIPAEQLADATRLVATVREAGARVVVAGAASEHIAAVGAAAAAAGAVVLNVGSDDDRLRGSDCSPSIFHVVASARMRADALAAWRAHAGGAADVAHDAAAVEWHAELRRFGASQLNDRCRERFGVPMDAGAWLGWMAAKVAGETLFRARGDGAAALRAHLRGERTRFDGHKGQPLSFRAWDQQLRQPLYVVHGERVVAELPDTRNAALPHDLDDYGAAAADGGCAMTAAVTATREGAA